MILLISWAIFFETFTFCSLLHVVYAGYLWFQLYSHTSLYQDEGDDVAKSTAYSPRSHHFLPRKNRDVETSQGTSTVLTEGEGSSGEIPEVELETPQMNLLITVSLLAVVTAVSYIISHTCVFALIPPYSW